MTPNPEIRTPKPVALARPPNPADHGVRFDDRPLMAVGIPGFGLTIPLFSGLLSLDGPGLAPRDAGWWAGMAWFVGLAFCIWWGNRWLLFKQREHLDWFGQPIRKLMLLVAACTLYTAPLTVVWLAAWYAAQGQAIDHDVVRVVALTNVICVIFVTHAYETVFLIRERESDALALAQAERSRAEAELAALKAQIDPHFLFNGLNTLGHLLTHDARAARDFCDNLAEVYRYVLANGRRDWVPLTDELAFVQQYFRLLQLRFGAESVQLVPPPARQVPLDTTLIVPLALQVLVENAVKHNAVTAEAPLRIEIAWVGDVAAADAADPADVSRSGPALVVSNPRRPRLGQVASAGVGLANLDRRCRQVTGRGLVVVAMDAHFSVQVPLQD